MRCLLTILLCFQTFGIAAANSIDSISTKRDVQKFLADNFRNKAITFLSGCAELSQAEKIPLIRQYKLSRIDTIWVTDPETGNEVTKILEPDTSNIRFIDTLGSAYAYPFDTISAAMSKDSFNYFKVDIDCNGYTDLVIDNGITVIIMDMQDSFKAHMFSDNLNADTACFSRLISLPDGTPALQFKHMPFDWDVQGTRPYTLDTIVYKWSGFAEYNKHTSLPDVVRLHYRYVKSVGEGDHSECIEVNKNGQCYFRYKEFDTIFSGTINEEYLDDILGIAKYLNNASIKDVYYSATDHAEGAEFIFDFADGTSKKIRIWAYEPPVGLAYLSKYLSDISKIIDWKVSKTSHNFNCPE